MEQLIQRLYEIFSRYGTPDDFPACQCCLSDEEKALLLSRKLRELKADELGGYAADVFLTVGASSDFKYFLPRILELSVKGEFSWPDAEVVFGKLPLAEWEGWPEDERAAISELIEKRYDILLDDTGSDGSEIDEWICALGRCVTDVTPYLDRMFEETHQGKLVSFVEWNLSAFTSNKLHNAFWESAPANEQRVLAWLNQQKVRAILSERYGMRF